MSEQRLTVAVVGASNDRTKFGNRAVRAYARAGHVVYPVHPREAVVEGLPAFRSVLDIPGRHVDRATLYLPAAAALPVLDELATISVGEVWLNPGADDPAVVARAAELGLRVVQACSLLAVGEE